MRNPASIRRRSSRAGAALLLVLLGGCASTAPPVAHDAPAAVAIAPPAVAAPVEPAPPPPRSVAPRATPPTRVDLTIVVDESAPVHADVATAIVAALPPSRYRVARAGADDRSLDTLEPAPATVIAVGRKAAERARRELPRVPTVFCQILGYDELPAATAPLFGVAAWPPASVGLAAWRGLDPQLRTVLLIVSEPDSALAAEARAAAATQGIDLRIERSSSDRETLYLFRRFAASIDGLWLLPDERALGPTALVELVRYAAARGVGVLAFSEALLPRGALLSATSVAADVAATVERVVERVVAGRTAELPPLTALSAAALTVNSKVAEELGLPSPRTEHWVAREYD